MPVNPRIRKRTFGLAAPPRARSLARSAETLLERGSSSLVGQPLGRRLRHPVVGIHSLITVSPGTPRECRALPPLASTALLYGECRTTAGAALSAQPRSAAVVRGYRGRATRKRTLGTRKDEEIRSRDLSTPVART